VRQGRGRGMGLVPLSYNRFIERIF
jgi:hypothetical protein